MKTGDPARPEITRPDSRGAAAAYRRLAARGGQAAEPAP